MIRSVFRVLRWIVLAVLVVWGIGFVLDKIGPTIPVNPSMDFDDAAIGPDLDAFLAEQDAAVPDLREGAEQLIIWAGETGTKTPISVVYVHGYSADPQELRPVPERMAGALGANLYFARLTGHGRDGEAMAEATAENLIADTAQALAVGKRLGERVILVGTSTGGTLVAIAAQQSSPEDELAGVAMISPNFGAAGIGGRIIEWPFVQTWGRLFVGEERGFEPRNEGHAAHWTTTYSTRSLADLGALTHYARNMDFGAITVPALFLVNSGDQVVDVEPARRAAASWGAQSRLIPVVLGEGDDPVGHVLAGDILSPSMNDKVTEILVNWARSL